MSSPYLRQPDHLRGPQRRHSESGIQDRDGAPRIKVFGEDEWKVRRHGYSRRRGWRKLHLSVNEATGEVLALTLTASNVNDGPVLPDLSAAA